jgi:hypothetical protein
MSKSLEEKDKKIAQSSSSIALSKEDIQGVRKLLRLQKSPSLCGEPKSKIKYIISAKEEKLLLFMIRLLLSCIVRQMIVL